MRLTSLLLLMLSLAWIEAPAFGQSLTDIGGTDSPGSNSVRAENEIVVTGKRNSDRFRIPQELRPSVKASTDGWRTSFSSSNYCITVGLQGCGTRPNKIVAFRSDGSVVWGDPDSKD